MFEKVAAMLAEYLGVDVNEITRESDIKKDLKADSLVLVELLFNLEDETGITVEDEAAKSLVTVGDVVDYIEKRLGK
jgi:acyl carrier protein